MIKKLFIQNSFKEKIKKDRYNTLLKKFNNTILEIKKEINNKKSFYYLLNKEYKFNFKIEDIEKFKKFKNIALIGMGGSILGSEAIYSFLKQKIKKNFYFFDNIDYEKLQNFSKKNDLRKTLFLVISKSGNTVETLSNLFFLNIIKKNSKNVIIISEKRNSLLYKLSKSLKLFYIEHNPNLGGRYSVLSEVGIVPAYFMGINIKMIRKNLNILFSRNDQKVLKESTTNLANFLNKNKFQNLILINYSPKLEKFLYWLQQLIAESLGKKKKGFLPIVSNNPKDHHSLLQLYLDGPRDKLFYVFSDNEKDKKKINTKKFTKEINFLENKTLNSIKSFQKNAFVKTISKKNIPFREFVFEKFDEETIGELFLYFILETIIIGKLTRVNPFDQPAVEQVKVLTNYYLKKFSK